MRRREFVRLSAGIVGGLGIPGVLDQPPRARAADQPPGEPAKPLDESYLELGLTGMAQAKGWFNAHWGAAVVAGYYLCKDNNLDRETVAGIQSQLDALLAVRKSQFASPPKERSDKTLIDKVPQALQPAVEGGLRAHGHAVIFASLSVKALRDVPQMAQPALINSLCGLSRQIARKPPAKPGKPVDYADTQEMIDATFDSLARFKELLGYPSIRRPNFTHMTTHTEALMNLEKLGYEKLARLGWAGHSVHIGEPVPSVDPKAKRQDTTVSLAQIMSNAFWEDEDKLAQWNQSWHLSKNRNGDWIAAGHLFKVLYSYHRMVARAKDEQQVRLCSKVLLERYFNPNVMGG